MRKGEGGKILRVRVAPPCLLDPAFKRGLRLGNQLSLMPPLCFKSGFLFLCRLSLFLKPSFLSGLFFIKCLDLGKACRFRNERGGDSD